MALTDKDKRLVGGSDAPAIAGISKWRTAHDVFARIVYGREDESSKVQRRGDLMEPVIRQMYEDETGIRCVKPAAIYGKPKSFIRANPDGIAVCTDGRRVVELKSGNSFVAREWGDTPEETPIAYQAQCQWYMAVTGIPVAHLVVLLGVDDLRIYPLEADPEAQGMLFESAEKFWKDYVLTKRPPPIDASESCSQLLIERFSPNSQTVQANGDAEVWAKRFISLRNDISIAEQAKREALNHLLEAAAGAKRLAGNGWRMTMVERQPSFEIDWETLWRDEVLQKKFTGDEQVALLAKYRTEKKGYSYPMVKEAA